MAVYKSRAATRKPRLWLGMLEMVLLVFIMMGVSLGLVEWIYG